MRIQFAGLWLAAGGLEGVSGLQLNGEQIVDEGGFFRAVAETFFARGRRRTTLAFSVERSFNTLRQAQAFVLTHYGDLPDQGDVVVTCGEGDDVQGVGLSDAVLATCAIEAMRGTSVRVRYELRGGAWTTDVSPGEEPDDDVIRRGTVALAESATEVEVTFSTAMSGTPTVVASVVTPEGGDILTCTIEDGSISSTGFTAKLSFPAPGATYKLSYIAIL